jgi:hypothetical protein
MNDTHRAKNIERTAATKAAKAAGPATPTGRHRARTTGRNPAAAIATAATAALTIAVAWVALTAGSHDQPALIADAAELPTTDQTVVNALALDFVADLTIHGIPTSGHGAHLVQMAERTCDHLSRHGIQHEQLAPTMKVYFADLKWSDRQALDYVLASHRYCETLTGAPAAVHTGHGT